MRVVYNSFHGRYSDSPRALYEALSGRPGLEHVWLADVRHRETYPADATLVDIDGPDARGALESADLVIASSHTEVEWDKKPGATYLQTWHGTPLKRIGTDIPHQRVSTEHHLRLLLGQAHSWDYQKRRARVRGREVRGGVHPEGAAGADPVVVGSPGGRGRERGRQGVPQPDDRGVHEGGRMRAWGTGSGRGRKRV